MLIDIHSHIIPGVDDGCRSLDESLPSIQRLQQEGFIGSICTPHLWPDTYPDNTPDNIRQWTARLQQQLADRGVDYSLWPGGELRLMPDVIPWLEQVGVPTLAGSNCVLCDFWEPDWPDWVDQTFDWLLDHGYQPILAHPERLTMPTIIDRRLERIARRGVLLQGNFRCLTGGEGQLAQQQIRRWLTEDRYHLLALDMHRPHDLESRLDGIRLVAAEYGKATIHRLTVEAPRRILGLLADS